MVVAAGTGPWKGAGWVCWAVGSYALGGAVASGSDTGAFAATAGGPVGWEEVCGGTAGLAEACLKALMHSG